MTTGTGVRIIEASPLRAHEIERDLSMDRKQAKEIITGLTYCDKLLLRELLLTLKQNREREQLRQESDQQAS